MFFPKEIPPTVRLLRQQLEMDQNKEPERLARIRQVPKSSRYERTGFTTLILITARQSIQEKRLIEKTEDYPMDEKSYFYPRSHQSRRTNQNCLLSSTLFWFLDFLKLYYFEAKTVSQSK
jgi:hypothetical protein